MRYIIITFICLSLSACFLLPAQPQLQQGNIITNTMLTQLKLGMTPQQVQAVMTSAPILKPTLIDHTLTYVYTLWPSDGKMVVKRLVLSFKNDKLIKIDHDHESMMVSY